MTSARAGQSPNLGFVAVKQGSVGFGLMFAGEFRDFLMADGALPRDAPAVRGPFPAALVPTSP